VSRNRPDNDNAEEKDKPKGPRTPYPVEHPDIRDQSGSEPDYLPGTTTDLPKM
jgi:hypothetical protein